MHNISFLESQKEKKKKKFSSYIILDSCLFFHTRFIKDIYKDQ